MLTLKKIHLCVAVSISALVLWPQVVFGIVVDTKTKSVLSAIQRKASEQGTKGQVARADGYTPICVELRETYRTSTDFFGDYRSFFVAIPQGSSLTCEVTGEGEGDKQLDMYTIDSNRFCSTFSSNEGLECSIGDGTTTVAVTVNYFGPPTRISLVCANEPCLPAECGDGFCSDGFETPEPKGGPTEMSCNEDCGFYCGDGSCDAEFGEDDTTCLADCFLCEAVDDIIDLEPEESVLYQIEVLEGESVYCYNFGFDFSDYFFVTMKYNEPPTCITDDFYFPFPFSPPPSPPFFFEDFPTPSPAPSSSLAPSWFVFPPPPFPNFCDPYFENDCAGAFGCAVDYSWRTQTLYVNVYAPFGIRNQEFKCVKTPCSFETDPPTLAPVTPAPTEAPTDAPTAAPSSAPTEFPTSAPTAAPVEAPTSAPTGAPKSWFPCFSGRTEVEVLDRGLTRMDALKIGDAVRSADGTFSKVYSFGHYDPFRVTEFLQIWMNDKRYPLEITGDHLLYVANTNKENAKLVPASSVKVGDLLAATQGSKAVTITSITTVECKGLYSPFTTTGNIVVSGVVASNYIALPAVFRDVTSFEQQHWLQHVAYVPYRLYCGTAGCQDEVYDEATGLSSAVIVWLPLLHFLESVLPWAAHAMAAVLGYLVWKKQHAYKPSKMTVTLK